MRTRVIHRGPLVHSLGLIRILDEKNERVRDTVRKKVVEYMARAEKIKEHLAKLEEKPKKKAMAASSNGGGGKGSK